MDKTCNTCRFKQEGNCAKFNIGVNENFTACNDYAPNTIIAESMIGKIELID